jgi:dienelactone hydrolase
MERSVRVVSAAALAVFLVASAWMGHLERRGPAHGDLLLEGDVPATLYLPRGEGVRAFADVPPRGERPAAVVLMHGFAGDRLGMSGLARRIARSGHAVLAIDAGGHGENRKPIRNGWVRSDAFAADLAAAVDFLRGSPLVDGMRIALVGHSMGAAAALDFATRDSGIDAVLMISGGWRLEGPYPPPNALFLVAESDPEPIRRRVRELAEQVAGAPIEAQSAGAPVAQTGPTLGRFGSGNAVRLAVVEGANHQSILWDAAAAREIVRWLDGAFGSDRARHEVGDDPRTAAATILAAAFLLLLPGVGQVVARLLPRGPALPGDRRAAGLLAIAGALALAMPLVATGTPAAILSLEVADVVVAHFAIAGVALLLAMGWRRPGLFRGLASGLPWTLLGSTLALLAIHVLTNPLAPVLHRMTLTPERSVVFGLAAAGLLPFTLAFELLLRRGSPLSASLYALAGRALVVLVLLIGVATGILGGVVLFMLPALGAVFVVFEALAVPIHAAARNVLAIAAIEAAWLALVCAATMPIRV